MKSALTMSSDQQGADHWRTGESETVLGECLLALGEPDSAEGPLRTGLTVLKKYGTSHPLLLAEANAANARLVATKRGTR